MSFHKRTYSGTTWEESSFSQSPLPHELGIYVSSGGKMPMGIMSTEKFINPS